MITSQNATAPKLGRANLEASGGLITSQNATAPKLYPESAPDGWRDALAEQHVQVLVSPLHDADVTADGTPKKPHWHVLAMV